MKKTKTGAELKPFRLNKFWTFVEPDSNRPEMESPKPGDTVKMEFDVEKRDKYSRLLGYVYLSDGKMLNEEIVKAGYANLMTIPPNVKYQDRFLKAYREARENRKGLWK